MSAPAPEPVIETDHLTKRFGNVRAVSDLSLRVPRGGVFGLLGPNGSGKSTTIGMLLGLVRPTGGSVRLFGAATAGVRRQDLHRIGAIVESPAFYPYLSGRANLRYFHGIVRRGPPTRWTACWPTPGCTSGGGSPVPRLLARHEAAPRHRLRPLGRPGADLPRRADQRPGSGGRGGGARPDPAARRGRAHGRPL